MKVLIIANYDPNGGGISSQVTQLRNHLVKDGHDVEIFSLRTSWLRRLTCFGELREKIKNVDVVHVHCCSKVGFYPAVLGITLSKKENKRVVVTYHGGGAEKFFNRWHKVVRCFLMKADVNIVLSGFVAKTFDKYNIPYRIIPNILPLGEDHYKKRTEIRPKFISVRTLLPLYNIECIIRAFAIVKSKVSDASLDILADGPLRPSLEKLVADMQLDGVRFLGKVPNTEIYDYLNRADVFLSTPLIDNQPVSILEAYKCGMVVISTNVGGVPYMVDDNRTGFLVENNNHEQLAEKMMWVLQNPTEAIDIANAGHDTLSKYTWLEIRGKIYEAYNQKI